MTLSRRKFLGRVAAGVGAAALHPIFASAAAAAPAVRRPGLNNLVLLNLEGGLDGLSLLIPQPSLPAYATYASRRSRIIPDLAGAPRTLNGVPDYKLHPSLNVIQSEFNLGKCAIVRKVGNPIPNFSHFSSKDLMSLGRNDLNHPDHRGWLGRVADVHFTSGPPTTNALRIVGLGVPRLLDFNSNVVRPVVINNLSNLVSFNYVSAMESAYRKDTIQQMLPQTFASRGPADASIRQLMAQATAMQSLLAPALNVTLPNAASYPTNDLFAGALKDIARMIALNVGTRIYYAGTSQFDTHIGEENASLSAGSKPTLTMRLNAVMQALSAFVADLKSASIGAWNQTAIVLFSEFGRRNYDNEAGGTDHGYGSHCFVLGGSVLGGLKGNGLVTADLTSDNLPVEIDIRAVYKACLGNWLGLDPVPIFDDFVASPQQPAFQLF